MSDERRFDLLVVPVFMAGSRSLRAGLAQQRGLCVAAAPDFDRALAKGADPDACRALLDAYAGALPDPAWRLGLVQHDRISDGFPVAAGVAAALAPVVTPGRTVLVLRERAEAAWSFLKHYLVHCGGDPSTGPGSRFAAFAMPWLDDWQLGDLLAGRRPPWSPPARLDHGLSRDAVLRATLHILRYEHIVAAHERALGPVQVVDFARLQGDGFPQLVAELATLAGVTPGPVTPLPPHDFVHRMLEYNQVRLRIGDHAVRVRLAYEGQWRWLDAMGGAMIELAAMDPTPSQAALGLRWGRVALVAVAREWRELPLGVQLALLGDGSLERLLSDVLYPWWERCYRAFEPLVADMVGGGLTAEETAQARAAR